MARSNVIVKMREIAESKLPSDKAILHALGDIKGEVEVLHSQVLVATYVAPHMSKGGILYTDRKIQEDQFQGSVGLVVAIGPGAFQDGPIAEFHGVKLKLHDWVLSQPADGLQLYIREVPCRLFEDTRIRMRVKTPELYW